MDPAAPEAHKAAHKGDLGSLKHAYSQDKNCLNVCDSSGRVPLHWASVAGHVTVVQWIIEQDAANVDSVDEARWTALIIACSAGHEPVARLLLSAGANIDAVTDQGRSALLYACSRNREAVAKMLLDNHANINLQDKLGASPLHRAASCGHVKIVKLLLNYSNQLDLNAVDEVKNTALHLACEDGNVEIAKMLFMAGADVNLQNRYEKTAAEMAKPEVAKAIQRAIDAARDVEEGDRS